MPLTAIEKWEDKQLTGSIQLFQTSTNQVWNVYLYLEDGDSLIILEDGMSCPVYNQHSDWLKNLQSLVEIKDYLFDKRYRYRLKKVTLLFAVGNATSKKRVSFSIASPDSQRKLKIDGAKRRIPT